MKLNVKVLGTGCPTCQKLYKSVSEVLLENNIDADLEKIEDLERIMGYGIMSVPALIVNDKIKFVGKNPSKTELIKYLVD